MPMSLFTALAGVVPGDRTMWPTHLDAAQAHRETGLLGMIECGCPLEGDGVPWKFKRFSVILCLDDRRITMRGISYL